MSAQTIDILMATYNSAEYISEQIESIRKQTIKNWRLIIRDDASTDNTRAVIKKYTEIDARISFIEDNLGNLGFVKNFEELLKHTTNDLIAFSDHDDIWFDTKLKKLVDTISNAQPKFKNLPVLVHSNSLIMNNKKKTAIKFIQPIASSEKFESFFFNFFVQGAACIINRHLKDIALPFPEKAYLHDRYLHLITELIGKRIYIDEPLMYYRQHAHNQIGSNIKNIKSVMNKRYFENRDKILITLLSEKFSDEISNDKKEKLETYQKITSDRISRFKKMFYIKKYGIPMDIRKQLLLLIRN